MNPELCDYPNCSKLSTYSDEIDGENWNLCDDHYNLLDFIRLIIKDKLKGDD